MAPTSSLRPHLRRKANRFISGLRAEAAETDKTIFGTRDFINRLIYVDDALIAEGENLATTFDIPGVTGEQLRTWLEDQMVIVDGGRYFVYLESL